MTPVLTTKSTLRGEKGNCLAATLASILDLNINDIPQFEEMCKATWKNALQNWSANIGIVITFTHDIPDGFSIGIGKHKSGELHAVILNDGKFHFDPNGTNLFYEEHRYCLSVERVKNL